MLGRLRPACHSPLLRALQRSKMTLSHALLSPVQVPARMEITLTETEDQLCTLLDESAHWMKEHKGISTSCRIAGGWVRDKLLGSDSNDIDVALEDVMGLAFAESLVEFASQVKNVPVSSVSKVESNPGQSKHLETAKTNILNTELDFVNLRSEEYAEGSRIPTEVAFGTPLQDALRRDITINALFYNVHTRAVEDHTGKGLDDLRSGTIRTPLPPQETFADDPLRVIRCIRFASRFGFAMVPELQDAARHPDIQNALTQKISRERVGEELHKMMKGRDPVGAVALINDLKLYDRIFYIPPALSATLSAEPQRADLSLAAAGILNGLLSSPPSLGLPPLHPLLASAPTAPGAGASSLARLYLAAALTPYHGMTYTDAKGKTHPATEAVLRDGLKLGTQNHYLDGIPALFAATEVLQRLDATKNRVTIGSLLREKNVHNANTGSTWSLSLLFSLVQELVPLGNADSGSFDTEKAAQVVERYNTFVRRVEELELIDAVDAKPILDGREVARALDVAKMGQWTGQVLVRVVEWQLEHPAGTKEECADWLRAEKVAGRLQTEDAAGTGQPKRGKNNDGAAKKAKR